MSLEKYLKVSNFISAKEAADLSKQFLADLPTVGFSGDVTCPLSPCAYNYLPFVRLLCHKLKAVEEVCGEALLPTYSYAREYRHGEKLARHTDREACEVSVTLNLSSDSLWPIYMDGEAVETYPGDAAIYRGIDVPHWREAFQGQRCVQVFLHYVRMEGPYRYCFYDRG
jgi:hypothetical protein